MKHEFPSFFNDSEKNPHSKFELLVDFWLSWTFRCSVESVKCLNEKMYNISRKILSFFLTNREDLNFLENKTVKSVYCNKYYKDIDLLVEVILDDSEKKYVLIFENKVFSQLKEWQLDKYKNIIETIYKDTDCNINYIFFRALGEFFENDLEYCKKSNFIPVLITDIQENIIKNFDKTNNDLFDEFWFNW